MRARKCTVRAVRAGASSGWSHFDALQRRHVRRSWSTAAYFESSRVCRHVILSKVLQTLPWGLKSTPRSRWHPLGEGQKAGLLIHGFQFVNHLLTFYRELDLIKYFSFIQIRCVLRSLRIIAETLWNLRRNTSPWQRATVAQNRLTLRSRNPEISSPIEVLWHRYFRPNWRCLARP